MESPIVKRAIEIIQDGDKELYDCSFNFLDEEQIYLCLHRIFDSYIYSNNFSPFSDQDVLHASKFCEVMMNIDKSPTYIRLKEKGLESIFINNPICFTDKKRLCSYYLRRFRPTIYVDKRGRTQYKLKKCPYMKDMLKEFSNFAISCETLGMLNKKQKKNSETKDGVWSIKMVNYKQETVTFRDVLKILDEIKLEY